MMTRELAAFAAEMKDADPNRVQTTITGMTYFLVMGLTFLATLIVSAYIAAKINLPLRELSTAASRIRAPAPAAPAPSPPPTAPSLPSNTPPAPPTLAELESDDQIGRAHV
mgnify:CR=1 FL=1